MQLRPEQVASAQGAYYVASGVWPLVHMPSFLAVTGPKKETWLVRTVGALIACIGATLLVGARRETAPAVIGVLGSSTAAALALIELRYGISGRIRRVYVADSVIELGLVTAWALTRPRRTSASSRVSRPAPPDEPAWPTSGRYNS